MHFQCESNFEHLLNIQILASERIEPSYNFSHPRFPYSLKFNKELVEKFVITLYLCIENKEKKKIKPF